MGDVYSLLDMAPNIGGSNFIPCVTPTHHILPLILCLLHRQRPATACSGATLSASSMSLLGTTTCHHCLSSQQRTRWAEGVLMGCKAGGTGARFLSLWITTCQCCSSSQHGTRWKNSGASATSKWFHGELKKSVGIK